MPLHFELVTPARLVRSEDVHMVVVPGTEGEFGVLEGHAPFMSTVRDGAVKVYRTEGGAPEEIIVQGGIRRSHAQGPDRAGRTRRRLRPATDQTKERPFWPLFCCLDGDDVSQNRHHRLEYCFRVIF